jgi:hypothetical protein
MFLYKTAYPIPMFHWSELPKVKNVYDNHVVDLHSLRYYPVKDSHISKIYYCTLFEDAIQSAQCHYHPTSPPYCYY